MCCAIDHVRFGWLWHCTVMCRAVRRIWVGFFYGLGGPNRGSGGTPPENFGFKVPQPLFFLVLLVQGDKKGSRFPVFHRRERLWPMTLRLLGIFQCSLFSSDPAPPATLVGGAQSSSWGRPLVPCTPDGILSTDVQWTSLTFFAKLESAWWPVYPTAIDL